MTTQEKRAKLKEHVTDMLNQSHAAMLKQVDKALDCGAVDVDSWDPNYQPMILPKCITMAIILDESAQYDGKGTSYERKIKKEVKNIQYFI